MIITIGNQKGGCGKSTVAMNLALGTAALKYTTALIDADVQRSCLETLQGHEKENLTTYESGEGVHRLAKSLHDEFIFIDTPPHSNTIMYQAIAVADLVIIPLQPSPLDIRSARQTVAVCRAIQEKLGKPIRCYFLLNKINPRTTLGRQVAGHLTKMYRLPILQTRLQNRIIYQQALIYGQSVLEYGKNNQAAQEVGDLLVEVHKIVGGKNK
jgi:chromosome partitioning protein